MVQTLNSILPPHSIQKSIQHCNTHTCATRRGRGNIAGPLVSLGVISVNKTYVNTKYTSAMHKTIQSGCKYTFVRLVKKKQILWKSVLLVSPFSKFTPTFQVCENSVYKINHNVSTTNYMFPLLTILHVNESHHL